MQWLAYWELGSNINKVRYVPTTKILGIYYGVTIAHTIDYTWKEKVNKLQGIVRDTCTRNLNIQHRIWINNVGHLSKIWYASQILPITEQYARQLMATVTYYIWKGSIFRVPNSTLCQPEIKGGLQMTDVKAKCHALFITRILLQQRQQDSLTAQWLTQHTHLVQYQNPPNWVQLPEALEYLRPFLQEIAYINLATNKPVDTIVKREIYERSLKVQYPTATSQKIRIQTKHPDRNWTKIWQNINKKFLPRSVRAIWYTIVHDIVPTNSRMNNIKLHDTGHCTHCGQRDTIQHRFTVCMFTIDIWQWTRLSIATFLRIHPSRVPEEWITLPDFDIYPPQRQNAVVWFLGHMISYITEHTPLTRQDYIDFLRRARKKVYNHSSRTKSCGKYLDVID